MFLRCNVRDGHTVPHGALHVHVQLPRQVLRRSAALLPQQLQDLCKQGRLSASKPQPCNFTFELNYKRSCPLLDGNEWSKFLLMRFAVATSTKAAGLSDGSGIAPMRKAQCNHQGHHLSILHCSFPQGPTLDVGMDCACARTKRRHLAETPTLSMVEMKAPGCSSSVCSSR